MYFPIHHKLPFCVTLYTNDGVYRYLFLLIVRGHQRMNLSFGEIKAGRTVNILAKRREFQSESIKILLIYFYHFESMSENKNH